MVKLQPGPVRLFDGVQSTPNTHEPTVSGQSLLFFLAWHGSFLTDDILNVRTVGVPPCLTLACTEDVNAAIGCDSVQPRAKPRIATVVQKAAYGPCEDILCSIFTQASVTAEPVDAGAENFRPVGFDK